MPETARLTRERAEEIARDNYGNEPAAVGLLLSYANTTDPAQKFKLWRSLACIDQANTDERDTGPPLVKRTAAGPGFDPDADDAEKEPGEVGRVLRFETSVEFLARVEQKPSPGWFVRELIPDEGFAVWHGRPRSMKSLCALDAALALAGGQTAFHSERFTVPTATSALYMTDEDGERLLAFRLRLLLRGRGMEAALPELLRLLARPGWNLEGTADQGSMLAAIREVRPEPRVLFLDPVRASLPNIDAGPRDAAEGVRFLRKILRETSVRTIVLPHHDVKPPRDQRDDRARAERASGGVIFSIGDCPVNFERVDNRTCLAIPSQYKVGSDPKRFRVRFASATPAGEGFADFIRAEATTEEEGVGERDLVLEFVRANPLSPTRDVVNGAGVRAEIAGRQLAALKAAGMVESFTGPAAKALGRSPRATLWAIPGREDIA